MLRGRLWHSYLLAAVTAVACSGEDTTPSSSEPECSAGAVQCSPDAFTLQRCEDGAWKATECMRDQGKLCEAGSCVDPWRFGDPKFDQCTGEPKATAESLRQKAEYFEEVSRRLHVHPKLGWMSDVKLPCAGSDCTKAGVAETSATWQDVASWESGENDGLWSALYLGAEAYRWAATKDPAALDMLKLLLAGEVTRMRVTGVPGIFTRQLIPPGIQGIACPSDPQAYVPDVEKDDNRWVKVGDDGCLESVDATTLAWKKSNVCGLADLAGYCFLDNVSEDEYAGHMFGLGAVAKLVDDADIQAIVKQLLVQVGDHLIEHQLTLVDWDGRVTEHGRLWAGSFFGGYNATMSLSFIKTIALATGIQKYEAFYQDCLLQRSGETLHWAPGCHEQALRRRAVADWPEPRLQGQLEQLQHAHAVAPLAALGRTRSDRAHQGASRTRRRDVGSTRLPATAVGAEQRVLRLHLRSRQEARPRRRRRREQRREERQLHAPPVPRTQAARRE
ncbi:MAG: hypothetical protein IPI67_08870 [Myxococcales bacterium]|nr:hypothetical protein [Myxococcales bacterium]